MVEDADDARVVEACDGADLARVRRLLGRARNLVDRAEATQRQRLRKRRLNRAARILRKAGKLTERATGKRATPACTEALGTAIEEARARTRCLSVNGSP